MSLYRYAGVNFIREADSTFIPNDPGNRDYQAVLLWISQGNTPDPEIPQPSPSNLPPILSADKNTILDNLSKAATAATTLGQLQTVVSQTLTLLKGS